MKKILILLTLSISLKSYSQSCNCSSALSYTIQKVEANYAGFKDKITNPSAYTKFTDSLKNLSSQPQNQQTPACAAILNTWLKSFKDGHLNLQLNNNASASTNADSIRASFAASPKVNYSEQDFTNYLTANAKNLKPLEGIWRNEAGNYTVGIKYQNEKYTAFILKADSIYWMPGQIKMEIIPSNNAFTSNFYMRDHSLQKYAVNIDEVQNGIIDVQNIGLWLKLDDNGNIIFNNYYPNSGIVSFKKLSAKTNLLTIRSFSENYRRLIDSIVTANDKTIRSAENLIIDVRGNGGGSDISFAPLEKYLFTNPYTVIGAEVYCTDDNIKKFYDLATDPDFTPTEQENFKKRAKAMEAHRNQFWSASPVFIPSDTFPVLPSPKHIAVIIDSFCASTTEQFLLDPVSNSKKAIMFGTHSAGVLDYANNYYFNVPETPFTVNYPTSRSKRVDLGKGIDNKGIQPQIKLNSNTPNWVNYVQTYLEKNSLR